MELESGRTLQEFAVPPEASVTAVFNAEYVVFLTMGADAEILQLY